jgi:hypothetical protein
MRRLRLLHQLVPLVLLAVLIPLSAARSAAMSLRPTLTASAFTPALTMVPSDDGTAMYIDAGGVSAPGTMFVNIGIGPGHNKGSWTMSYSETLDLYVTTAAGFTPGIDTSSELNITTTLGLATPPLQFMRAFVRHDSPTQVTAPDGNLGLSLISADTLPADSYIAIVPSYAPPGAPPSGYQIVGATYSVRASGSLLQSERPMSLRMAYSSQQLGGIDPHTLQIAVWDPLGRRWDILGGELQSDPSRQQVAVTTVRFGSYALVSGPAWSDSFADLEGLDLAASSGVTLGLVDDELALVPEMPTGSGTAVSRTISAGAAANWGTATYSARVPLGAQLAVDILSADGGLLLADIPSGADISSIDVLAHPSVRLRARMAAAPSGARPGLFGWGVSWQGADERSRIYLPALAR